MEIFLLIVSAVVVLVIIGKLIGDPDIGNLDVAELKREIWVTQNWINNYHSGGCPLKYQEKFQYKQSRLEQANERLNKLSSRQTNQNGNAESAKPENVEQEISPELENSAEFKNFLILDSIRHLTDLALSHGLIQSQDEAHKYWGFFKKRIQRLHMKDESATLDEIKSSIVKELAPVFEYASGYINEGMTEELAMAHSVVNWYKTNNSFEQTLQPLSNSQFSDQEVYPLSNTGRSYDKSNHVKEFAQYRRAAKQGDVNAQFNLGELYKRERDFTKAEKWYRLAAEQGFAGAQRMLAQLYRAGKGASRNDEEEIKWWKLAAEQGDVDAQNGLARAYEGGYNVPQNFEAAIKWWKLAAAQGNYEAQENLATMYALGNGVLQDYVQAHMWLNIAAFTTDSERLKIQFIESSGRMAENMTANQIAEAQELARKRIANNFKEC